MQVEIGKGIEILKYTQIPACIIFPNTLNLRHHSFSGILALPPGIGANILSLRVHRSIILHFLKGIAKFGRIHGRTAEKKRFPDTEYPVKLVPSPQVLNDTL